jgi:hypothetical protein
MLLRTFCLVNIIVFYYLSIVPKATLILFSTQRAREFLAAAGGKRIKMFSHQKNIFYYQIKYVINAFKWLLKKYIFCSRKKSLLQILESKIFILVCQKRKYYNALFCVSRMRCLGFCQAQPQLQVKLSLKAEFALFSINRAWKMTLILREMEDNINLKVTGRLPQFVAKTRPNHQQTWVDFEDFPHFIFGWLAR